jgi:hypothetical protein
MMVRQERSDCELAHEREFRMYGRPMNMNVFALPYRSPATVFSVVALQAVALQFVVRHEHRSLWLAVVAFFIAGFVTDLISGLAHFGFDYVWPSWMPVLGPVADEFKQHHEDPTLDPSALMTNFTKAGYGALPFAVAAVLVSARSSGTALSFLIEATVLATSIWMLGFHQIHSYAHMGETLSSADFNRAVAEINRLPSRRQQKAEFAKLFESLGIPPVVRFLQRWGLFLRPEVHWRHHASYESDFSSVNGWSDPVTNWIYGPIARRRKAAQLVASS